MNVAYLKLMLIVFPGRRPLCQFLLFSTLACGSLFGKAFASPLVIVASANFKVTRLTKSEVEAIFLQKRVVGPGQQAFVPVFLPDTSDSAVQFAQSVLGKSMKQLRAYWNLKVLTGRLKPPVVVETTEELITYLNRNNGSLGYMNESFVKEGLKILYRDGEDQ